MWKISGSTGQWMSGDNGTWTADAATSALVRPFIGEPVLITPTGPAYTPKGTKDEVGHYLLALSLVPGPYTVTGTPPVVPAAPALPDGAVA